MNRLKQTENILLILLWALALSTFTVAVLNNYSLFISDYIGLAGLAIVTGVFIYSPDKKTKSLFFLLIPGVFNLASFIYFYNVVFTFGFGTFLSPGVQLLSLGCMAVLVLKRQRKVADMLNNMFGKTEEDIQSAIEQRKEYFRVKFSNLSDSEIDVRLQNDLQSEAKQVLLEIQKERKENRPDL